VEELTQQAQLILIQIGQSQGLSWEVRHTVLNISPQKLVLCLPMQLSATERKLSKQNQYARFRKKTSHVFPQELPHNIGDAQFICFDAGWKPYLISGEVGDSVFSQVHEYPQLCHLAILESLASKCRDMIIKNVDS
jgi:hypothetical protein